MIGGIAIWHLCKEKETATIDNTHIYNILNMIKR